MQDFSCLCKKLCNAHVSHSNWGEGIIRDIDEKYVQIKFSSDQIGLKRFLFPEAFNPSAPDLKLMINHCATSSIPSFTLYIQKNIKVQKI